MNTTRYTWATTIFAIPLAISFVWANPFWQEAGKRDSIVMSPDRKQALLIATQNGRPELWVTNVDGTRKKKISKLKKDEGATPGIWSPDGNLIAFVSYNLSGHSPMTTTHVWVARSDGSELRMIVLPNPNKRFSTYDPEWMTNDQLVFVASVLPDLIRQKFLYSYRTRKIRRLESQ